jgi:hypothetical protein
MWDCKLNSVTFPDAYVDSLHLGRKVHSVQGSCVVRLRSRAILVVQTLANSSKLQRLASRRVSFSSLFTLHSSFFHPSHPSTHIHYSCIANSSHRSIMAAELPRIASIMDVRSSSTPPEHGELEPPSAPRALFRYGRFRNLERSNDDSDLISVMSIESAPPMSSSPPLPASSWLAPASSPPLPASSSPQNFATAQGSPIALNASLHSSNILQAQAPPFTPVRGNTPPSAEDSQQLLHRQWLRELQWHAPASAGLFVGNLPNKIKDSELNNWLSTYFSAYGPCAVEVQRKTTVADGVATAKPHAIVQYAVSSLFTPPLPA